MAHVFKPSIWGGRGRRISEFEASLVYRANFRVGNLSEGDHPKQKIREDVLE